jgi:outer membrane protein assembly factor BamB
VPLVRRWGRALAGPIRPIGAEGVPPSAEASRIFLVQGTVLRPVDPATGDSPWSVDLGGKPVWVGYLADKIIAATETRLMALGVEKGAVEWQYDLGSAPQGRRAVNPFAGAEEGVNRAEQPEGNFRDFRIVGGHVFCLRGEQELLAFDGDSGLIDWSYSPTSGSINPNYWIGPQRIVLQVRKPHAVLVLETATGRRRAEYPLTDEDDWTRPPLPIDDNHLALVTDRRTVALFDVARGTYAWVFRESRELPRNGPPRLLGDAERLLVIHDGNELIRLDTATGMKLWSRPLGMDDLSERPEAIAIDGDRFYWVSGQTLSGGSAADGSLLWARHLAGPEKGWAIALTERCVMAYPRPSRQDEGKLEQLPIVFRRRDNGDLVQRLLFPVDTSDLAVRLGPRGVLVATQSGLWALGERSAVDRPRSSR